MITDYEKRIELARIALREANFVLVGGGAGLSAAAGLTYEGRRFSERFSDFVERYGLTDMYSAGFYPFASQEEKWAYWSRHIWANRYEPGSLALYGALLKIVRNKDYFVVTTNVDAQFEKSGFDPARLFCVQGDYGKFQCAAGCHAKVYDNEDAVRKMKAEQRNCRVPSALVPRCPVCDCEMEVHIRKDGFFVEDDAWESACRRFEAFCLRAISAKTVFLEIGVGFNTPGIIRFPFERMTARNPDATLIRINRDDPSVMEHDARRTLIFSEDAARVVPDLENA